MSRLISVDLVRAIVDGGCTAEDIVSVASAVEGPSGHLIEKLFEDLRNLGSSAEVITIAVCAFAASAPRQRPSFRQERDEHSSRKDSNRSRRGISCKRWRALRAEAFERDGYSCQYCGDVNDLTCDHITPLVRGGSNDLDNLTTACRSCNSSKGDKSLSEWREAFN